MAGLKEYMGDPDEIVRFIADSEIVVDHLAPFSAEMFDRLTNLRFYRISWRSSQYRHGSCAKVQCQSGKCSGRNASAVAEFTIGAILAETRLIRMGHELAKPWVVIFIVLIHW